MKLDKKAKALLLGGCSTCKYYMVVRGTSWSKSKEYQGCANIERLRKIWKYEPKKLEAGIEDFEDIKVHRNTFDEPVTILREGMTSYKEEYEEYEEYIPLSSTACEYHELGEIKRWSW